MASKTEASLLSKLESSNSTPIYSLFSDYRRPFSDVNEKNQTLIPKLASKFLSFLKKSLAIIPDRLSDSSNKDHTQHQQLTNELFNVFRLCLDCLDLISSQLSYKPYLILVHRVSFVYCLESYRKYEDAESEEFGVLKRFRDLDFNGKSSNSEFARVFLDAVAATVKCAALWKTNVVVLDANEYDKLHGMLMTYLHECSLFFAGELVCFNGDLLCAFTKVTLTEYAKSSMKDQMYKFSCEICSSLFSLEENKPIIIKIIFCVLGFSASQCEAEATLNANVVKRFVEENQRLAEECSQWKREYESVYEALLELENKADERNKKAQVRIHDLEAKLSEVSYVLYFYKQQYQTLGRLFEENFRLTEEYRRLLNVCLLYDQDCQALMKIGNEADEKAKEAKTRVHDLEVQLDQVLDELNFYKLQYHYSKLSGRGGGERNGALVEFCKQQRVVYCGRWVLFKLHLDQSHWTIHGVPVRKPIGRWMLDVRLEWCLGGWESEEGVGEGGL
ncbi:hypothetical protein LWI28_020315 [Acer negundo]|uniref:Separase-like TPR repeats region domain-containing protein n=1 Tax=Acer negundo TaxID=4023 RepID=A0AAD5IJG9_ACENE|nr:hypothetical protein LWI28_020315 [Acer negundo]